MENFHKCREDQEKEERERREKKRTQKREQKRKSEGPYYDVGLYLSLAFYLISYNHISLGNDCKLLLLCLCYLNMRCNYY